MSKFIESLIECPFYIKEGNCFIACEGLIEKTVCSQSFKKNSDKTEYETKICSVNGGKGCTHHRSVALLYEKGIRN